MSTLKIHDTLTGKKVTFEPREPGKVGIYVCGPTVYDYSHLGHARVYVVFDAVVRFLRQQGHVVTHVRNFTDIDDKIIARANELGVDSGELAEKFIAAFSEDMDALGVQRPDVSPKVTEHVPQIIRAVGDIIEQGKAYERDGSVYFAVRKHPGYGKLSKRNLDELQAGARVDPGEAKEDPLDFALWKAAKPAEPSWDSPWGPGRPGWHIECSVMSTEYLSAGFDLHGGGMDLIFPHHENEIGQAEAISDEGFSKYWLHNGFVNLNQEKMAKSTGNFFSLRELFARCEPEAIRLFLLSVQYRHPINFRVEPDAAGEATFPDLDEAAARLTYMYETKQRLGEFAANLGDPGDGELAEGAVEARAQFIDHMLDDFNTAAALAPFGALLKLANRLLEDAKSAPKAIRRRTLAWLDRTVTEIGGVLGILEESPDAFLGRRRSALAAAAGIEPAWIEAQIEARTTARKNKDFGDADRIRDELADKGVELMDGPHGTRWRIG